MDKSSENALMLIALTMEAVRTSETPVYFSETTRRYIPEGCHLHTRGRQNLISHYFILFQSLDKKHESGNS
jgi:hypothetical protein